MVNKINVERQFDDLLSHKADTVYDFNSKKMSRKDKGTISCLENYGLKGKKCLDIGSGTGRWAQFIASNYLKEIQRVTKPGGLILMSLPNIVSFISRVRLLLGILPPAISNDPTHVSFYRKRDIEKLMKNFGLSAIFIPTLISINPATHKGILRIPSNIYITI